jgi:glucose-1-phosphate adenylyltransferase
VIKNSIVGLRSQISDGVFMKDTIMMGSDYYDEPDNEPPAGLPLGIGHNCRIEGAIIDKNVRMGEEVVIKPFPRGAEIDSGAWVVQDGIVVMKDTVLHPGTYVGRIDGRNIYCSIDYVDLRRGGARPPA